MFPFVFLGSLIAIVRPLKEEYDVFFFFPGFAIGGAERVNAEIVKTVSDKKVIIFFTKNSPNDGMKHFFQLPHVTIREISFWTDKKWMYWGNLMFRGICSAYINRQKRKPSVFIGQCNFGYKLTPHIRRDIKINELIHMYDPNFTWVWAPFTKYLTNRIVIGDTILEKFQICYEKNQIPLGYLKRFKKIFYRLEYMPTEFLKRNFDLPLRIYYAGRGGPQKRIHLILQVIEKCRNLNLPVTFALAGPLFNDLPKNFLTDNTYIGEIQGGEQMYSFHKSNDILMMTSAWEGFPLVIMEAMSFGSIPLVTNVDAIPDHIKEGQTGFLINGYSTEETISLDFLEKIQEILRNRNQLAKISENCYNYAAMEFSGEKFTKSYREVILETT